MALKYGIGDYVVLTNPGGGEGECSEEWAGSTGMIDSVDSGYPELPYRVLFDEVEDSFGDKKNWVWWCSEEELDYNKAAMTPLPKIDDLL